MPEETRLLRRTEVGGRCQLSCSAIYRMTRAGLFPKPIKLEAKAVRWAEDELTAWLVKAATGDWRDTAQPLQSFLGAPSSGHRLTPRVKEMNEPTMTRGPLRTRPL